MSQWLRRPQGLQTAAYIGCSVYLLTSVTAQRHLYFSLVYLYNGFEHHSDMCYVLPKVDLYLYSVRLLSCVLEARNTLVMYYASLKRHSILN